MTQVDNKRIAEIADRTPTSEAFFTYAACRSRNARDGVTPLRAIRQQLAKEGFLAVPQDLLSMFRELERAGVGVLNRAGEFKWNMPIKKVGEMVTHKEAVTEPTNIPVALKKVAVFFADNRQALLEFTPNLTKEEVAFLAQKIIDECK